MSKSNTVPILFGLVGFWWLMNQQKTITGNTSSTGGFSSTATGTAPSAAQHAPTPNTPPMLPPSQPLSNTPTKGATLIGSNTTFYDKTGNMFQTGNNQTVSKLPSYDAPVVLTVRSAQRDTAGMTRLDRVIANAKANASIYDTR